MRFADVDLKEVVEFVVDISRHLAQIEPGSAYAARATDLALKLSDCPTEKELELILLLRERGLDPLKEVQRYVTENDVALSQRI